MKQFSRWQKTQTQRTKIIAVNSQKYLVDHKLAYFSNYHKEMKVKGRVTTNILIFYGFIYLLGQLEFESDFFQGQVLAVFFFDTYLK